MAEETGGLRAEPEGQKLMYGSWRAREEARGWEEALPYSKVSRHCLGLPAQPDVKHSCVRSPQGHQLHTHAFLLGHGGLGEWGAGSVRWSERRQK